LQFEGDYGEPSGAEAAGVPAAHRTFDAVFAPTTRWPWARAGLPEHGVHTPSDLLVVGYDDHPLVRYSQPALTTVRADMVRVGAIAARRLLSIVTARRRALAHATATELSSGTRALWLIASAPSSAPAEPPILEATTDETTCWHARRGGVPDAGGSRLWRWLPGTSAGGVTTLTYWSGFTGGDRPTYEALIKKFNDTHPASR